MTSIRFALVSQAADLLNAGKSPWITIKDGEVQGVYVNRDAARAAKNGSPTKYVSEGLVMSDDPTSTMPKGEDIADAMGHGLPTEDASVVGSIIDDSALTVVDADAAAFAEDKPDLPAEMAPSVAPVPPLAPAPVLPADKPAKLDVRHQSEIMRPTKMVWHIADKMCDEAREAGKPLPTRKEVMAECDRLGIAFYTARTQYQVWKSMQP